jgi:RNAse (barnase) inhibitor barstar
MSGLAALLAGRAKPGVYRWHAMFEADDVRHTVELAGWRFAHYSGWIHEDKAEVLEGLGRALSFPDHYGRNLDALADALKDVVAHDSNGTLLLWDGWAPLARAERRSFDAIVEVLQARADAERGGPFPVLLRGDGEKAGPFAAQLPADVPEIADLPSLD